MAGIHKAGPAAGVGLVLALLSPSCSRPVPSQPLADISAVCQLSRSEAARGYPVSLVGRVTFVDARGRVVAIEDGRAGIRIDLGIPVPPLQPGNTVSIGGVTARGEPAAAGSRRQPEGVG